MKIFYILILFIFMGCGTTSEYYWHHKIQFFYYEFKHIMKTYNINIPSMSYIEKADIYNAVDDNFGVCEITTHNFVVNKLITRHIYIKSDVFNEDINFIRSVIYHEFVHCFFNIYKHSDNELSLMYPYISEPVSLEFLNNSIQIFVQEYHNNYKNYY